MKFRFIGNTCNKENIIYSEVVEDVLRICHTMRDNLVVAFYGEHALFYDADLICRYKTVWSYLLPVTGTILEDFGVAPCHSQSGQTGFICVFNITG